MRKGKHCSQLEASKAYCGSTRLSLSGTGGSWKKSPEITSFGSRVGKGNLDQYATILTCMPPKGLWDIVSSSPPAWPFAEARTSRAMCFSYGHNPQWRSRKGLESRDEPTLSNIAPSIMLISSMTNTRTCRHLLRIVFLAVKPFTRVWRSSLQ